MRLEHLPADVLGLSPLARRALAGGLPGASVPRRLADLPRPPERLDADARARLARTLEQALAPLGPHVAVLDAARALARPGAACVVTGQQPGFLASPLYSLYKALQALRLAALLRERWQTPVVALFWNHADDHDVAEVHHAHVVNENLDLQRLGLAGMSSGRQPLSRVVLDDEAQRLGALRARLAELLRGEPHVDRALELFFPRAGESLARAFTRAFTELLGPLGLIVLEPDWIRDELSRALARVVAADPVAALEAGAERVRAAGLEPAIEPRAAALVYQLRDDGRHALRPGGDGFRFDDEPGSRTGAELAAEIVQHLERYSPGALLRPIAQDLVLPVCAYVGGFGELAYHVELGELRARLDVPATPFVPRVSCTLVEPECDVALAKLELSLDDYLRSKGAEEVPDAADPGAVPDVAHALRASAASAAREIAALRAALAELDPGLAVQAKKTADQVRDLVEKLAAKAERVHQNASGKGRRHRRRLASSLLPRGEAQERVLGPLAFVARFGEGWIEALVAQLDPLAPEHVALYFEDDGAVEQAEEEER